VAVLAGGVDVAADVEPVLGGVFAGEPAGDLLLGFGGPYSALWSRCPSQCPGVTGLCAAWSGRGTPRTPGTAAAPSYPPRSGHRVRTSTPRSVIWVTPRAGRSSRPAWAR
jgi:hypothetical protein